MTNEIDDQADPVLEKPTISEPSYAFEYKMARVKDIQLEIKAIHEAAPALLDSLRRTNGCVPVNNKIVTSVIVDGEKFAPTGRFWHSFYSRFKLNGGFFRFFDYSEVFSRISEKKNDRIRITIERNKETGDSRLLAATGLNKSYVVYDDLLETLKLFKTDEGGIRYHDGVVVSTHTPRIGQSQFKIAGDKFSNKYELHCPIDGYGSPDVYLSLLRWVCSNGAVGFANAFKTSLSLGTASDNTQYTIKRALESFTNDEGYAMLRGKFESAAHSWASIREHQSLYRVILGLQNDPVLRETIKDWNKVNSHDLSVSTGNALLQTFTRYLGDPYRTYNNDPQFMSSKRQRSLPMQCKVYDMFNFATELATHYVSEAGSRQLQAWVGNMISDDFDLEDSCDQFSDWRDVFLNQKPTKG